MKFQDIPQFTRSGSYQVNIGLDHLKGTLARYEADHGVDLNPDFQRDHVWTEAKQIAYVEFLLRGGVSSRVIYWNCTTWHKFGAGQEPLVLVDGKQRLEAVRRFMRNEIPAFGLCKNEYSDELPGMQYTLIFNINDLPTRAEVLTWYLDLNAGGVVHTQEELDRVRALLAAEEMQRAAK